MNGVVQFWIVILGVIPAVVSMYDQLTAGRRK